MATPKPVDLGVGWRTYQAAPAAAASSRVAAMPGRATLAVLLSAALIPICSGRAQAGEPAIFADGFESGSTSAWTTTVGEIPPCPPDGLSRYDHLSAVSPVTPCVATKLQTIVDATPTPSDDVFMKAGSTGSASANFLRCFSDPSYRLDLDGRSHLQQTVDFFAAGDAGGVTPYERDSVAVAVGRTATWVVSGAPAPFEQEITTIGPRLALVDFGTDDMQFGVTFGAALKPFYESMQTLLDALESSGVVPIITGLNPRSDDVNAAQWLPTWDAVSRGIAEQRQLPYLSLYRSMVGLPNMGLSPDGVTGNVFVDPATGAEPCDFTAGALQFNYNVRNLTTVERLDIVRRVAVGGQSGTAVPRTWQGSGASGDPIVIDELPFTHTADTSMSPNDVVDAYPVCGMQDMSGPEYWYRLDLEDQRSVRFVVLDGQGVDVDVHLISGAPQAAGCIDRDDELVAATLPAGTYHVAVDTYVAAGVPQQGEYLLAVIECEPGDGDCS